MNKAHALATLCDAQIAIIVFSITGKLYEFSSSDMSYILSRYGKDGTHSDLALAKYVPNESVYEVNVMQDEITSLRTACRRMMGKELEGLSSKELLQIQEQITEAIISVKDKKEELLREQLKNSELQEEKMMLENKALRKQVEELQQNLMLQNAERCSMERDMISIKSITELRQNLTLKDAEPCPMEREWISIKSLTELRQNMTQQNAEPCPMERGWISVKSLSYSDCLSEDSGDSNISLQLGLGLPCSTQEGVGGDGRFES